MLNNKIIKKIYNEGKKVVKMNPYGNKKIFTKENKNEFVFSKFNTRYNKSLAELQKRVADKM